MSKNLKLEEEVATVLREVRQAPRSLIPHLQRLQGLFLADTPVLALTATRRLRVPEGRQAVEIAIDYLQSKSGESPLDYSYGMSEAARAKFNSSESLTERLKVRGQWTGTCSDFVQLGVEDLDPHTIVSLMIISAGDEKRQIRERIFSTDKNVVGVAIGPYKQSTAVAVTLATKFVANGPTEEQERQVRGGGGAAQPAAEVERHYSEATAASIDAMRDAHRPAAEDYNATDEQLEERKRQHFAQLEAQRNAPNARVTSGDDDPEMAQIQRDRLAALQALERTNAYSNQTRFEEPVQDPDDLPPHLQAQDGGMESYEEAEARKRAFFEEQERQKRDAIVKAEESRKNAWKNERAAREEQKRQEEAERLRRLQEGNMGPRPKAAAAPAPFKSSQTLAQHAPPRAAAAPVNSAPRSAVVTSDNPELDELQKERMAKISALEQNSAYGGGIAQSGMEDNTNVVGGLGEPAAYDPTRETYEEAEARKRAWFAEQERIKRETMLKAEAAQKNNWKAERAAREEAKKREEAERIARLQSDSSGSRKLGGGGYTASAPVASTAPPLRSQTSTGPVVRQAPVQTAYTPAATSSSGSGGGGGGGGDDDKDAVSKEEERMMRTLAKKQGGAAFFGKVDAQAAKEEEMKKRAAEAKQREEQVARLREEKWKQETLEAEKRAAARAAEAEAKARALAAGVLAPQAVVGEAAFDPVSAMGGAAARAPPQKGNAEDAVAELEQCSENHPVTLYLNALIRDEESMRITSLAEVRDGVSFWSRTGHKVSREGKYAVGVAASPNDVRHIRIPSRDLVNDDFNALSDYFFFGTAEYLTLYPSEALNEAEVMHVSDLTTLSPGERYFLASGNVVEIIGGATPQFLINGGEKEVALPEEIMEQLRY